MNRTSRTLAPSLARALTLGLALSVGLEVHAQVRVPAVPPAAAAVLPARRLVGLEPLVNLQLTAQAAGATVVRSLGDGVTPLGLGGPARIAELAWADGARAERGAAVLRALPGVRYVELNTLVSPFETIGCAPGGQVGTQQCTAAFFDATPTAPEYQQQPALAAIDVSALSPSIAGAVTRVAVIDTGIDPSHPALVGRLLGPGFDFVRGISGGYDVQNFADDDGDGLIDEGYGHGTHVAGTITLIDPDALILPYRVLDSDGVGTAFDVAQAILAADDADVDVINLSLGLSEFSVSVAAAIDAVDDDVAIVASAGNGGTLWVGHPARIDRVVAVAAVGANGVRPRFTSFGPEVDLVAPGVEIYGPMPGGQWATWSGSSMAAAVVSGAVARLHSWRMNEEPDDVVDALIRGALSVDPQNPGLGGLLGAGLVRLGAASLHL